MARLSSDKLAALKKCPQLLSSGRFVLMGGRDQAPFWKQAVAQVGGDGNNGTQGQSADPAY
jgi:hypothetical protein